MTSTCSTNTSHAPMPSSTEHLASNPPSFPSSPSPIGRLAPSPTGLLHLGNAWSFLWAWLWTKSAKGKMVLRMEDIDPQRSRTYYAQSIEDDLRWLGLLWDDAPIYQSKRQHIYQDVLAQLRHGGHVYPCYCTRKELRSLAGAPHVQDYGAPYPGICRDLGAQERKQKEDHGRKPAWRLACVHTVQSNVLRFTDAIYGEQSVDLQDIGGDFALCRSDGVMAYQLAVVVDDAAQGITQILRGSDILVSTPRQLFLQQCLGYASPVYAHVPLLLDAEGERLAKRHASLSLQALRQSGVSAQRILGLLAHLAGYVKSPSLRPIHLAQLLEDFSFAQYAHLCKPQERKLTAEHMCFLYA